MYTGSTQAESPREYPFYERRLSHSNDHPQNHAYRRQHIELPRPLEPRPSLHTSLSESSGMHRRHEAFRGPLSPDYRSHPQNLPGLRDILSPGHTTPGPTSHNTAWTSTGPSSSIYQSAGSQYHQTGLHPPMALYPRADMNARYQIPQSKPFEVPILDTNPVGKQLPPSLPVSPYGYPDSGRDFSEVRSGGHAPAPSGSYLPNGISSPFTAPPTEDAQYRSPAPAYDRVANAAYAPTSTDSQKKYIGVTDVPGEGSYHVYEGGLRIPTHVDGEQVNPAWGLTKANKPRKRLALACLDCREKKIKCEPGTISCLQCEKAKRTCRRAPIQPSQSDTTSTSSWQGTAASPARKTASTSDPTPTTTRDTDPDPLNKRRTRHDPSPPNVPSKKHRSVSPISTQDPALLAKENVRHIELGASGTMTNRPNIARVSAMQLEDDPYAIDPDLSMHLFEIYFAHINNATYCLYPRAHFLQWVKHYPSKCQNERMTSYAILAVASLFADERLSGFGKQCSRIAGDAVLSQVGKFNIATVQTKILLGLYHFAKGSTEAALDYLGSAIGTVTRLRLNTEEGCLDDGVSMAQSRVEFVLSRNQLAECKRRTFWSAFLMDRYCGMNKCMIKPEDIFVRLPCTDDMYERGTASDAPYLPNGIVDPAQSIITPASPLTPMAWLVVVSSVWGDVIDFLFRAPHRTASTYNDAYKAFYDDTSNRLQGWCTRLPPHLQYNEANLDRSIQQGYAGTFISMHTLYHLSQMKLNRYLQHSLAPELVSRNIRVAHSHGHQMLQMMTILATARREISVPAEGQPPVFSFSTPFPGYATLMAIDIVAAGEWESNLGNTMDEIYGALGCLRELAAYWSSSKEQLRACETRYYQMKNILANPVKARSGAWLGKKWGMETPLEQEFDPAHDCIWGLGDSNEAKQVYFDAFHEGGDIAKAQTGGLRIG